MPTSRPHSTRPATADDRGPLPRNPPTPLFNYRRLSFIAALFLLLFVLPFRLEEIVITLMLAIIIGPLIGLPIYFLYRQRQRRLPDENYGIRTAQTESLRKELLKTAKQNYPAAPLGTWHFFHRTSGPLVENLSTYVFRTITFDPDGTGTFLWQNTGPDFQIHTAFRYQPGTDPESLRISITSPSFPGTYLVNFGFDVHFTSPEQYFLFLWFESPNPLAPELDRYWPFHGTFSRDPTCAASTPFNQT